MVVVRSLRLKTYIIVAIITSFIFSFGLLLGLTLDDKRISTVEQTLIEQEIAYKSLQIQHLYISTLPDTAESCPVLEATLQNSVRDLNSALETLETYKSRAVFKAEEFKLLSQSYVLENLRYWLLAKRTRDLCSTDIVTVLYFYSDSNCGTCPDQGTILSYYKRVFQDRLLVFPINTDLKDEEGAIKAMLQGYSVSSYPSLVVGDDLYSGLIPKEDLQPIICSHFISDQTECISN